MVDGVPYFPDYRVLPVREFHSFTGLPHYPPGACGTDSDCPPWMTLARLRE